jgi:hypothetical protein
LTDPTDPTDRFKQKTLLPLHASSSPRGKAEEDVPVRERELLITDLLKHIDDEKREDGTNSTSIRDSQEE